MYEIHRTSSLFRPGFFSPEQNNFHDYGIQVVHMHQCCYYTDDTKSSSLPPFSPLPLVFWKSFDSLSFAERMDGWSCARSYDHIDRHKPPVYRLKQSELTRQTFSTLSLSTTLRCRLSFLFQDQPRRAELTGHVRSVRFAPILKIRQCSRKVMQQRAPCGPACFSQLFNTRNHGDARRRPQGQRWGLV